MTSATRFLAGLAAEAALQRAAQAREELAMAALEAWEELAGRQAAVESGAAAVPRAAARVRIRRRYATKTRANVSRA